MVAQPAPWQRDAARSSYVQHLRAQQVSTQEIAAILRAAALDAERQIAALMPDPRVGASIKRAQLQQASLYLRQSQAELWGHVTRSTQQGLVRASRAAVEANAFLAEYLTRALADPALASQFTLAARNAAEVVRAKYLNDVRLSTRVFRNQQVGISRAHRTVAQGLAQGRSAREIARSVRHLIRPDTPGGVSYAAMRLARTEINNAFHTTSSLAFADSPFVEGVKWELSGSHPRPDICDDLAEDDEEGLGMGIYRPMNIPAKPHPHCLCFTIAVTVTRDQFINTLLNGGYDNWLISQGMSPVGVARSVG